MDLAFDRRPLYIHEETCLACVGVVKRGCGCTNTHLLDVSEQINLLHVTNKKKVRLYIEYSMFYR